MDKNMVLMYFSVVRYAKLQSHKCTSKVRSVQGFKTKAVKVSFFFYISHLVHLFSTFAQNLND